MPAIQEIETERLLLRQWKSTDFPAFAQLTSDEEVMQFFPSTLSQEESRAMAQRCADLIAGRGWGFWAAEDKASGTFMGFIGLHVPAVELPFSPCVEIGWRLARAWWGKGLATEGARAALQFAFMSLSLEEVVSFTSVRNARSEAVMRRLGMRRDAATFEHPSIPMGHPLREHCLYRATAASLTAA